MTDLETAEIRAPGGSVSRLFMGFVILGANLLFGLRGLDIGSRMLIDTDGHMRYNRVLELVSGLNGWWDGWAHRANAPFGHSMHWTRPLDALLVVLAAPVAAFSGWPEGLYFASLLIGPLLHLALGVAVAWTSRPLVGVSGSYLAGMGVASQSGILSYAAPGRPDHHILILVLAVLMMGTIIRLIVDPQSSWTIAGGLAAAGGLWVSTEFLVPLALALAFLGWLTVVGRDDFGRSVLWRFCVWLGIGIMGALLLERPAAEYLLVEYDRISIVHLLLAGLAGVVGWFLNARWRSTGQRLAIFVTGGVASAVAMRQVLPLFFEGPFAEVPERVANVWLVRVAELAPLWDAAHHRFSDLSLLIGSGVIGLVLGLFRFRRQVYRSAWAFVLVSLAFLLALSVRSVRFSVYPAALGAIPIAAWASERIAAHPGRGLGKSSRRVFVMSVVVVGMAYPFMIARAIEGSSTGESQAACDLKEVVAPLTEAMGSKKGAVVLASVDSGPELLYRLPVRVVADPYHRNTEGILDSYAAFGTRESTDLLDKHEVKFVLVCEHDPDRGVYAAGGLYSSLIAGSAGPDFRPIELDRQSSFRLYERVTG